MYQHRHNTLYKNGMKRLTWQRRSVGSCTLRVRTASMKLLLRVTCAQRGCVDELQMRGIVHQAKAHLHTPSNTDVSSVRGVSVTRAHLLSIAVDGVEGSTQMILNVSTTVPLILSALIEGNVRAAEFLSEQADDYSSQLLPLHF